MNKDMHRANKVITRTAASISAALDKVVADLPESAAPQMAIEEGCSRAGGHAAMVDAVDN